MSQSFVNASAQGLTFTPTLTAIPLTVAFWVKTTTNVANSVPFSMNENATGGVYLIMQEDTLRTVQGGPGICLSSVLTPGTWYHILSTYTNDTDRLSYVNGTVSGANNAVNGASGAFTRGGIGCYNQAGSANNNFDGLIVDLALWNSVLSSENITKLSQGLHPLKLPVKPVSYWPLSGSGQIHDIVGSIQSTNVNASVMSNDNPRFYR